MIRKYYGSSWSGRFPVNTHSGDEDEEELTSTMPMRGRSNTTVNTHTRRTKHTIGRSRRRPTNVTKKTHKKTQPSFFERKKKDAKVTNEGHEEATMARKKRNGEEEEEATEIAKKKKWRKWTVFFFNYLAQGHICIFLLIAGCTSIIAGCT